MRKKLSSLLSSVSSSGSTLTSWHAHPLTRNHDDNGWACDGRSRTGGCKRGITGFRQTTGVARYRCAQCDYDLCDMCFEAATKGETDKDEKKSKSKVVEDEVGEDDGSFEPTFLNEQVALLAEQEKLSDVVFIVGTKRIPAHRLFLAATSPFFQEMLYKRGEDGHYDVTVEKVPLEVKIEGVEPETFQAMIKCIYSDEVEVTSSNIQSLIKVANKYQIEKLKILCSEFMEGDITKDNVLDLFQIAPSMLGDEEFGLKFIEENAPEVLQSDSITKLSKDRLAVILKDDKLAVDEIEVFKALVKWGEAEVKRSKEKTDLKTVCKDLVKLIRFPTMEVTEIATLVGPSGMVEQSQLVGLFSYASVTDESIRSKLPDPGFPTQPREGGVKPWTWDPKKKGSNITFSNKDLTAQTGGYSWNNSLILGNREFKSGDHYWEIKIDHSTNDMVGVCSPHINHNVSSAYSNCASQVWFVIYSGGLYGGTVGTKTTVYPSFATGNTIGIGLTWNKSSKTFDMSLYKNRSLIGVPFRGIPGPVVPAMELCNSPARVTLDTKVKKP